MTSITGQTTRVGSSATRSNNGSSQFSLHSQWLSKNVSTSAIAASAPRTRERTKPSRFSFRITRTLLIFANSKPSSATTPHGMEKKRKLKRSRWEKNRKENFSLGKLKLDFHFDSYYKLLAMNKNIWIQIRLSSTRRQLIHCPDTYSNSLLMPKFPISFFQSFFLLSEHSQWE